MAKADRFLQLRNGRYYVRVPIPMDLRHHYPTNSVRRSLNTSDVTEARGLLNRAVAIIQDEFDAKRNGENTPEKFSEALKAFIASRTVDRGSPMDRMKEFARLANFSNVMPNEILNRATIENATSEQLREWIILAQRHLEEQSQLPEDRAADKAKAAPLHKVVAALTGPMSDLIEAQVKEAIPAVLVPDNVKPYLALNALKEIDGRWTLQRLTKEFFTSPDRAHLDPATKRNYTATFGILVDVVGADTPIRNINRDHIREVQRVIINCPPNAKTAYPNLSFREIADLVEKSRDTETPIAALASGTRNKYLRNLGTLFSFAYDEGKVDANPALRLTVTLPEDREEEGKEPFSVQDIAAMFPRTYRLEGNNWIPLVMLFSGMRPGEAAQLDTADVIQRDGVWGFDITDETKGAQAGGRYADKSIKTEKASRRFCPIHQRLIDLGFLAYVEERQKAGHNKLFNTKRYGDDGYYPSINDEFTAWLEGVKVKTDTKTPHSLRHTWNTHAFGRVDDNLRRIMGGWSLGKGVDVGTYLHRNSLSAADMKRELDKLRFNVLIAEPDPDRVHDGLIARKTASRK